MRVLITGNRSTTKGSLLDRLNILQGVRRNMQDAMISSQLRFTLLARAASDVRRRPDFHFGPVFQELQEQDQMA